MITKILHLLRRVAFGLTLALAAHGSAHAGLVRGNFDPEFGAALPNLSWQVRTEWLVPNACSNSADGVYSTSAAGPCQSTISDPVRLLSVWVRWFNTDTGDPNNFFEYDAFGAYTGWCESTWAGTQSDCGGNTFLFNQGSEPLSASNVRVAQSQIVGFDTGITSFLTFNLPTSAGTHQYDLGFTTNGPIFTCADCAPPATASNEDLRQFLVTYTDDAGNVPKFTDSNGNALGALLDGNGTYLGQVPAVVPEPGTLVLALAALTAIGWSRRRRHA